MLESRAIIRFVKASSGISPDDIGKYAIYLNERPEGCVIENDYSDYNSYYMAIPGVEYRSFITRGVKYGRCCSTSFIKVMIIGDNQDCELLSREVSIMKQEIGL